VRDFASRRGASEVKWLESNEEQKNQRDPLAWTEPEQASKPQSCMEGASRPMRSRTGGLKWPRGPLPTAPPCRTKPRRRPDLGLSWMDLALARPPWLGAGAGMARRRAGEVRRWRG